MAAAHLVLALALLEFFYFGLAVARARATYKVPAPAMTGNEVFERYFRVQMNTLEQLIVFIPSILIYSTYFNPYVAAAVGAVFLVGRLVYLWSYVKDPKSRTLGFGLSAAPTVFLLIGGIIGAVKAAVL